MIPLRLKRAKADLASPRTRGDDPAPDDFGVPGWRFSPHPRG